MTILTFRDYEVEVLKLERKDFDSATKLMKNATGLAEEAGEALSHVRKHQYNGQALDLEKMKKELGDVLWYVVATANVLGMSFREIAEANVEKLQKRYPKGEYSHEACVAQADEKPPTSCPHDYRGRRKPCGADCLCECHEDGRGNVYHGGKPCPGKIVGAKDDPSKPCTVDKPAGWACTRGYHAEGPCAAVPVGPFDDIELYKPGI